MLNTKTLVAAAILAVIATASQAEDTATVTAAPIHTITPVAAPPDAVPAAVPTAGTDVKPVPKKARHVKACRKATPTPASRRTGQPGARRGAPST